MRLAFNSERPNCACAVRFRSGKLICTPAAKIVEAIAQQVLQRLVIAAEKKR